MKKHVNKVKELIFGHKVIVGILLLVILFFGYKTIFPSKNGEEYFVVKKGDVVQKVIVNGKTKPVEAVDLGFQTSGTVGRVYAKVGTRVGVGDVLASLDSGELNAQYQKAQANLAGEEARLEELKKGAKPEEIAVAETSVSNAKVSLSDAQKNLRNKVIDAITNNIDQLFSNSQTNNPQFNLPLSDSQLKSDLASGRVNVENAINTWKLEGGETSLPVIKDFIDNVALAVNRQSSNSNLSQTTLDGYKADVSSARSSVITAESTLNDAKSALVLAEKNLALEKSGSTPEVINSQQAKILQAKADLQNLSVQLGKTTLKSPQFGIVTKQEAKVGQVVTPGQVMVSIISDSNLEVESNVSEVSIGKVAVDNLVDLVFDAFPGEVFKGKVTYIEPGETLIDGVVNFKIRVAFLEKYPQIKSGLTSRLDIFTGVKSDVLTIPQYALTLKDGKNFVTKKVGEDKQEVEVSIGLKGQDGYVEVLSGLNEGDTIEYLPAIN